MADHAPIPPEVGPVLPAVAHYASPWSRRLARPEDDAFLDQLYEGTRIEEVLGWGFDAARARSFLHDQARMQRLSYAMQYPAADHWVLLADAQPIGRLILHRAPEAWSIISVSVLPTWRGRGLGAWAIQQVLGAAQAAGQRVRLLVDPLNPARRLYQRLGFRLAPSTPPVARQTGDDGDDGRPVAMEWMPC